MSLMKPIGAEIALFKCSLYLELAGVPGIARGKVKFLGIFDKMIYAFTYLYI